jgi:FKBP-type peptidyl-prolyl cis-trans isomerase (trigger factor)
MDINNVTIQELPNSEVSISGEISWEEFKKFEQKALERLIVHLELPGFRKGHVPFDIAKKNLSDDLILTDMAELAVQEFYPTILKEKNIDAIGRPRLALTKLARDNALGFTIQTYVLPDIKLPDYKKIAGTIETEKPSEVTEEEVDKVIEDLRQIRAYGHVHTPEEGAEHKHDEPLPEVTDEFAKSFGDFKDVSELREKIKENTAKEKLQQIKDKKRVAVMEAIIKETKFDIPVLVLEGEQEKMFSQIEADISRAGMTMEDYLKMSNKTKEAMLEELKPEAEKRARFQLVINAIARDAKMTPTDEEVETEAQKILSMYPGADIYRSRAYADMVLTNEKVLSMLESQ